MTYKIYEEYLDDVKKKLNRIAKKCRKYGNDFYYDEIGEMVEPIEDEFGRTRFYKFIIVEVEGTAKIDDWEFVAALEIHDKGNIIRKYNNDIDVPERFRHTENICEHCNTRRFRNNLYIIHNIKTEEWKQVGKDCLNLYTNGLNAEYVTAYMDGITELEERNGSFNIHGEPMYALEEVLGYATEIIDKIGYFNANAELPTKSLVRGMLLGSVDENIKFINRCLKDYKISFEKEDFLKPDTDDKVKAIIDYYNSLDDDSDFTHNIQAIIANGIVSWKSMGFVAYMPEGYNRHIKKERVKRERQANEINGHFGVVGKRYNNLDVKDIVVLSCYENAYGLSYFCKIVLDDNRVLYWSGKGIDEYDYEGNKLIPDKISFTVKEHGEYKGTLQTKVTRCRINYKIA